MDENLKITPNESWKAEISRYLPRLDQLLTLNNDYEKTCVELWPEKIWPTEEVKDKQLIAFKISAFATSIFSLSYGVTALVVDLWKAGRFISVPLNSRFVFESWATIHYAKDLLEKADVVKVGLLTDSLLSGVYKSTVQLPTGGHATQQCPNIMEYIRLLDKDLPGSTDTYNFLSSASHPNALQNIYFSIMSPPFSKWGEQAHELLNSVLTAHECSHTNMQTEVTWILRRSAELLNL